MPEPVTFEELFEAFDRMSHETRFYAQPGIISTYDPLTQLAAVSLALNITRENGEDLAHPTLSGVRVMHLQTAHGAVVPDVAPFDKCLLVFCDRSIDKYMATGTVKPVTVGIKRRWSISDAVAIMGLTTLLEPLDATKFKPGALVISGAEILLGSSLAVDFVALAGLVLAELSSVVTTFNAHGHANCSAPPLPAPTGPIAAGVPLPFMSPPGPVASSKVKSE